MIKKNRSNSKNDETKKYTRKVKILPRNQPIQYKAKTNINNQTISHHVETQAKYSKSLPFFSLIQFISISYKIIKKKINFFTSYKFKTTTTKIKQIHEQKMEKALIFLYSSSD